MHPPPPPRGPNTWPQNNACPRAWAATYRPKPSGVQPHHQAVGTNVPRTLDQAIVRALRRTWLDRTRDHFLSKAWSTKYREARLMAHLETLMHNSAIFAPAIHVEMAIQDGLRQLERLEACTGLRPVFSKAPCRWAYFERLQSAPLGDTRLFAAPDLAVYHQHRWTLIRIQFRSPSLTTEARQLEHLLMVHWAMRQGGLPKDHSAYTVKVIRWTANRWVEHRVAVTREGMAQSMALVEHDLAEMKWMLRSAEADPQLHNLPLAAKESTCVSCHVRETCPAKNGLKDARERQEAAWRLLAQSADTKSARTA
jgi:hypothetical protein